MAAGVGGLPQDTKVIIVSGVGSHVSVVGVPCISLVLFLDDTS